MESESEICCHLKHMMDEWLSAETLKLADRVQEFLQSFTTNAYLEQSIVDSLDWAQVAMAHIHMQHQFTTGYRCRDCLFHVNLVLHRMETELTRLLRAAKEHDMLFYQKLETNVHLFSHQLTKLRDVKMGNKQPTVVYLHWTF
jgi:hypothetical protein